MNHSARILFVGGGTGGHLRPGVILATELQRRHPEWEIGFLLAGRSVERNFVSPGFPIWELFPEYSSRPPLSHLHTYLNAWRRVRRLIRDVRPQFVVHLGGYVSFVVSMAKPAIPAVLLESDRIPGKAARVAERFVRRIYSQWPGAIGPVSKRRVTGMPVEWNSVVDGAAARAELGLDSARQTLLVFGGSQGARAINDLMIRGYATLAERGIQLVHLTGAADYQRCQRAFERFQLRGVCAAFEERMDLCYAASDLGVTRAGGMTVTELCAAGLPALLIPYPYHRDAHQEANARMMVAADAAWMIRQEQCHGDFVTREVLPRMVARHELERFARNAAQLGKPDAKERIADDLEQLISRLSGRAFARSSQPPRRSVSSTRSLGG